VIDRGPWSRIARCAALAEVCLTVAYFLIGILWLRSAKPGSDPFRPADPYLACLEILIILSAIAFVFIAAAARGTGDGRWYASAGLGLAIVFAALTSGAHLAQLTVLPRTPPPIVTWPSVPMALDLVAWELFFGSALVCIALTTWRRAEWPRSLFLAAGVLCLAGASGPASGHLKLHLFATTGYAVLFPAGCLVLWLRSRGSLGGSGTS